jgi:hypothetical protein
MCEMIIREGVFPPLTDIFVANMVPYAISSSLILVIHENMINGTNHIV